MSKDIASVNTARNAITRISIRRLSSIPISGFFTFIVIIILLHFFNPDFDPLKQFMSEYITGNYGWLLNAAFIGNFIGCLFLTIIVYHAYPPPYRSWTGIICLSIVTITILSNFFPADLHGEEITKAAQNHLPVLIHLIGGLIGTLVMLVGMFAISIRLKAFGLLKGFYRVLLLVAIFAPIFFLVHVFVFDKMLELVGLGQRIFVIILFTWPIVTLYGIRSGSITPGE